jgi:hypothetical protein
MMGDGFNALSLITAEVNLVRTQALDLFDRCLAEGNPVPIIGFIERQLIGDPIHLQLLRDIADDLQQRLISLRTYHNDVRDNVVRTFSEAYNVDITPLAPANAIELYHHLVPQSVIGYAQQHGANLSERDVLLLSKMLEESFKAAARLYEDVQLTAELQQYVLDWLDALNMTVGRRFWAEEKPNQPTIH